MLHGNSRTENYWFISYDLALEADVDSIVNGRYRALFLTPAAAQANRLSLQTSLTSYMDDGRRTPKETAELMPRQTPSDYRDEP
jgi:hypothetical protein